MSLASAAATQFPVQALHEPSHGRLLLVRNPAARSGGEDLAPALGRFAESGWRVEEAHAAPSDSITGAILGHRGSVDRIVVAGGDGTLNRAAPALIAAGLPVGILPLGTANDLARTLGLPVDLTSAASVVINGRAGPLDVGLVNERPFFNVASIGLSAEVARTLTQAEKRRWGRLGYVLAGLRVLARARPFRASIRAGTTTYEVRSLQIAVGNGRHYGGGNVVAAGAAIDDGMLDLYSLEFTSRLKLLTMVRAFRRGEHGHWPQVRTMQGPAFEVTTRRPRSVNADGELVTKTPARFEIRPAALRVMLPR